MPDAPASPGVIIDINETPDLVSEACALQEDPALIEVQATQLLNAIKHIVGGGGRKFVIWAGDVGIELHVVKTFVPPGYQPPES